MPNKYDLAVIGAGPGGYVAAIKAAQLGKNVVLFESREVGGTCLNRGCIPTKTLVHTTSVLCEIKNSDTLGINVTAANLDFGKMQQRKTDVVEQLRSGVEALLKANGVELVNAHASVTSPHTVSAANRDYSAENILLACGSKPTLPPIPGLDLPGVVTSDQLLEKNGVACSNMVIIGGGVIGVEFASIYSALGCAVTVIEAQDRILPLLDREISQNLSVILKKQGVNIFTGAKLENIQKQQQLVFNFTHKNSSVTAEADTVLVAIGRTANTSDVFADSLGIETQRGQFVVNKKLQTNIPSIYAIGDARFGSIQLAHAASAEGVNAVCDMFGEKPEFDTSAIASCIYTNPEIASVGITDADAKQQNIPVKIGKYLMNGHAKNIIEGSERSFIKLVFHAETSVLLGAQLMCPRATDIISELSLAVVNKLTASQIKATIHPHPTFIEGVLEAVDDAFGATIHTMPRRNARKG